MPRIAISYRRSDSAASAGRIADRLASRYGKESVFIDVDSVPVGTNFREYIQQAWSRMDVLIVVVGRQWLGETEDAVRIHERMDPVRLEVETAMRIELPIIPVLVDDARMP